MIKFLLPIGHRVKPFNARQVFRCSNTDNSRGDLLCDMYDVFHFELSMFNGIYSISH